LRHEATELISRNDITVFPQERTTVQCDRSINVGEIKTVTLSCIDDTQVIIV
tara:strand:- start:74360 stop:74515 length:156 start_codon:yes stop_codon:yes gene_type:complete